MPRRIGEEVAVGAELVEIEADKANMAYESDVAGTLTEVFAEEGDNLPIGTPIALVGTASDLPEAPWTSPTDTPAGVLSSDADSPDPRSFSGAGNPPSAQPAGVSVGEER